MHKPELQEIIDDLQRDLYQYKDINQRQHKRIVELERALEKRTEETWKFGYWKEKINA